MFIKDIIYDEKNIAMLYLRTDFVINRVCELLPNSVYKDIFIDLCILVIILTLRFWGISNYFFDNKNIQINLMQNPAGLKYVRYFWFFTRHIEINKSWLTSQDIFLLNNCAFSRILFFVCYKNSIHTNSLIIRSI